jgi:molybdenum cofactor biosynthesis protein MoaC
MTDVPSLTHIDAQGGVRMVDVADKPVSVRTAVAGGRVLVGETVYRHVSENKIRKGNVLTIAQIAGIMGAKQTSKLIPLCHDVSLNGVDLELTLHEDDFAIDIRALAKTLGHTGVEMEALTAVSIAALTVYDMCKSISKSIRITDVHLLAKTGGQSGDYRKEEN